MSEVFGNVGENINVPPSVTLTVSCDHLISTLVPFNITWTEDGNIVSNGSITNVLVSQDEHQLILAPTKLSDGGQLGNSGIYTCTVCSNNETCVGSQSDLKICGKLVNMFVNMYFIR